MQNVLWSVVGKQVVFVTNVQIIHAHAEASVATGDSETGRTTATTSTTTSTITTHRLQEKAIRVEKSATLQQQSIALQYCVWERFPPESASSLARLNVKIVKLCGYYCKW